MKSCMAEEGFLGARATLATATAALATMVGCAPSNARAQAALLCRGVARSWLPLLDEAQVERLWAPAWAHCLPEALEETAAALLDADVPLALLLCGAVGTALRLPGALARAVRNPRALCALPTHFANATQGRCGPEWDAASMLARACCAPEVVAMLPHVSALWERVCASGHPRAVAHVLLHHGPAAGAALALCADHVAVRVAPLVVAGAHSAAHMEEALGAAVGAHPAARHTVEHVLVTHARHERVALLLAWHALRGAEAVRRVALAAAELWSDAQFVRRADALLQLQCSRVVCWGCDTLPGLDADLLPLIMGGVQRRLGAPDLRLMAMAVAERCARGGQVPLSFGEPGLDDLMRFDSCPQPQEADVTVAVAPPPDDDPDALVPMGGGGGGAHGQSDDDDDDDDSLSSCEMEDESAPTQPVGPAYLRDCMAALREQSAERHEAALTALNVLLPARPLDLDDVAVALARALLHLHDEYALANFVSLRMGALTALCVESPAAVEYLGAQVHAANFSVQQRLDAVECALLAVRKLSAATPSAEAARPLIEAVTEDGKTRRWGNARRPTAGTAAKRRVSAAMSPERAASFFWPYAAGLHAHASLDPMVLARLMLYLGSVVAWTPASDQKRRVLDSFASAVWSVRWTPHAAVSRACMVALTEALQSVDPTLLVAEEWAAIMEETVQWLSTSAARDAADADTAHVARVCLSHVAQHVQHAVQQQQHNEELSV